MWLPVLLISSIVFVVAIGAGAMVEGRSTTVTLWVPSMILL